MRFAIPTAVLALLGSCADPVRDDAIDALGPEDPGVAPGADHRPGQPCLLCHARGGPASTSAFAVAGTIYATNAAEARPAPGITVGFVDARGGAPAVAPVTGPSGNFYVPLADWKVSFPVRVGLYTDERKPPIAIMKSLVNREGSCNTCHRRSGDGKVSPDLADDDRNTVGPIYLTAGAARP